MENCGMEMDPKVKMRMPESNAVSWISCYTESGM